MYKKLVLIASVILVLVSGCGDRIKMKRTIVPEKKIVYVDTVVLRDNIKKALKFIEMNRIVGEVSDKADMGGLFNDPEFGVSFYRTAFRVFDYINTGASSVGMFEISTRPELVTLIRGGMSISASNIIYMEINQMDYDHFIGKLSRDSLINHVTVLSNRIDYECDSFGIVKEMTVTLPDSTQFEYLKNGEIFIQFMIPMLSGYQAAEDEYRQVYLRKYGE